MSLCSLHCNSSPRRSLATIPATHKLAPILSTSWFGERLLQKVQFRSMSIDEAIADLAEGAAAGPDYRDQLRLLLNFLDAAGLVSLDDNRVTARATPRQDPAAPAVEAAPEDLSPRREQQPKVATSFVQPTEGVIKFHVAVAVDMAEMGTWKPERISAFFGGVAQVLAAKGAIEQEESQ